MDGSQFDNLTRTLATSRRNALKFALGALTAGLGGSLSSASAARRGFPGPPNPFESGSCGADGTACGETAGRICCNGSCCPPNRCCNDTGQCTVCDDRCEIQGQDYASGAPNPDHACQVCDPTQNHFDWSSSLDGLLCGASPGRLCCNGECCSPTECCTGIACEECGPHCLIGGVEFDPGTPNPQNECEVCDPARVIDAWSDTTEGIACNGGDGCCSAGSCGGCSCLIEGESYPDRTDNPRNECQECIYARDPNDWSNRDNGVDCGNDGERDCCDGECCPANQCCTVDGCELCCRIPLMSESVADGVVNPQNTCQVCDASHDGRNWTTLDDGEACGATGNSECCNGECCPSGQCCRNGACGLCDCEIGGQRFDPDEINQNNPCEICKPALNRFAWSGVGNGTSCGVDGETCCGTDCCSSDHCCLLDACGECLCSIENDIVEPQERNPQNTCQLCDPHADPFDWSTVPDRGSCGSSGDQQCCNGFCCDPGQCCLGGACRSCGCFIDGQEIAPNALNPANACQICFPDQSPDTWSFLADGGLCGETAAQCCLAGACVTCGCLIDGEGFIDGEPNPQNECQQCDHALDPGNWSPRNETFGCGADGAQICCNGTCCPTGNCCNLDDICEPCRCEIEGVTVEAQQFSPDNHCLLCDPGSNTTSWTFGPDYSVCSDPTAEVNRFCCQGICCEEHECCRSDGTCGPCTCDIEGAGEFEEGERNPANDCQICNPTVDRTGWQTLPDGDICGANLDQTCCSGQCGCPEGCLIDGVHYADGTIFHRCDICDAANNPNDWTPRDIPDCPPPCLINGVIIRYGTVNPDNLCQICHGGDDWSPSTELFCGSDEAVRVCCDGVCCESGACCSEAGACGFDSCEQQGCVIDGVQYEDGTENPANACQVCNISQSTSAWTPQFGQCGPNFDRFCCDGVCCDLGACCNNEQVCDFDFCQTCAIDGVLYFPEDLNPANSCQWCISNTNKFAWTTKPDNFFCDEMQLTVCCNGACCNPGEGCIGGVCQPN